MLIKHLKRLIKRAFFECGYEVVPRRWTETPEYKHMGFDEDFIDIMVKCLPFTMTSPEKWWLPCRCVRAMTRTGRYGSMIRLPACHSPKKWM
jgi:hypothetical protein